MRGDSLARWTTGRWQASAHVLAAAVMCAAVLASPAQVLAKTGTKLSHSASARTATAISKVTLTGTLKTSSGHALGSRSIRLERYTGGTWALSKRYTTNSRGKAYAKVQPSSDTKYRFRYTGSSKYRGSTSSARSVGGYKAPTQDFTGSGTTVVGPFTLEKGLSVACSTPGATSSNFIVWLVDSGGNEIELLANEIGQVACSKAMNIATTGSYYLNVTSDTSWAITIQQPRQLAAPATRSFGGDGQAASALFSLSKTAYKFTWSNSASSNFIVWLLDRNGNMVDLIANEIGSSSGSVLVGAPAGSQYILDVYADGPWSVDCATP
jgi:hypothetical protein